MSLSADPRANSGCLGLKTFSLLFTFTLRWYLKCKLFEDLDMQAWPTSLIRLINTARFGDFFWGFWLVGFEFFSLVTFYFVLYSSLGTSSSRTRQSHTVTYSSPSDVANLAPVSSDDLQHKDYFLPRFLWAMSAYTITSMYFSNRQKPASITLL